MAPINKSTPQRTCLGCGVTKSKTDLVRLVIINHALTILSPGSRGAYLCQDKDEQINKSCYDQAKAKNSFQKAFKTKIIPSSYQDFLISASGGSGLGPR